MTTPIKFTKMQGAGNDYIYINALAYTIENPVEFSKKWSACHTGIGSDGLVLIGHSDKADFSMRIFNADGSEAMMCGNASRCIGKYVYDKGLTDKTEITLDTLSGIKRLKLGIDKESNRVERVTVDMGNPVMELVEIEKGVPQAMIEYPISSVDGRIFRATAVSMGNPHLVIFTNDIRTVDLETIGPLLENHPLFPNRINVEFAQIVDKKRIRMRVWERGSGITQACGTGACATAVAAVLTRDMPRCLQIDMDGGSLEIRWDITDDRVYMTGGAVCVFEGEIETE